MEARQNRTILSAGLLVNALLRTLPEVNVYPVMAPAEGEFPALVYRRADMAAHQVKDGRPADTSYIEMEIWTRSYAEGIDIAEKVRALFDNRRTLNETAGLYMRSCFLDNAYENGTQEGLFVQYLRFVIKV